tara:strand:- start:653 stop:1060 length:408 start_codon:yes stop_codon:yes gene_type:complete
MAIIEKAVYARLSAVSGVTNLVPASRIFPVRASTQKPTSPFIVYLKITDREDDSLSASNGIAYATIQIDIYSNVHQGSSGVFNVAEQVRLACSRYSGTSASIQVDDVLMMDSTSTYEGDAELYRVSLDTEWMYRQ